MYTEKNFLFQKKWSEDALFLLRKLLPLMSPVPSYPDWTNDEIQTLGYILSATARTSESALQLCAYGQLWDAEILVRSILEGTLKLVYLLQSKEQFKERFSEYSQKLWEIGLLKDHEKAHLLLEALGNPENIEWKPIRDMLLPAEELSLYRERYPKPERRDLDRRWGFTGMISELINSKDALFSNFTGFAHGYSIASHLAHADYTGVSIPMERDYRSLARRETIHLAHLSRLISDVFVYFEFRLLIGYRFTEHSLAPIGEAVKEIRELMKNSEEIYNEWITTEYGSQDVEKKEA